MTTERTQIASTTTGTTSPRVPLKQSILVALAAGLGYGFDSYAVNIYGLVLPGIQESLGVSLTVMGIIGSIFLVGYTVGTIGFGIAADRYGRKDTLGISILVYGVSTSLAGLTSNLYLFTGLRFLTGVGGAGELAVGAPYTSEMFPAKARCIGTGGIMFSLYSAGYILAAGTALVIVPRWGWQLTFIVAVVPALLLFAFRKSLQESARFTVAQAQARRKAGDAAAPQKRKIWSIPQARRRIYIGWLIYSANAFGYWGMTVFLTTYMVQKFGATPTEAIMWAMVFYIVQFVLCYVGAGLADLVGRRPMAILGALMMMICTVLGATTDDFTMYLVYGSLTIGLLGWLWSIGDTYITELFPTEIRGTGFAISVGGGRIVSIAAPFVVGWAISSFGPSIPYLAMAGLWILTIVGYVLGPETAKKELEETGALT
ncbi:MFS transporter [Pseudonocardia hispaniensis]|uniref:MFS transporter n=1 Tax=Pseudonocardia hispaniensis TaxID=904933 RepID=A0ABW1J804_9PSEU